MTLLDKMSFWRKKPEEEFSLPPLEMAGTDQPPLQPFTPERSPLAEPPPFTPSAQHSPFSQSSTASPQDRDIQLVLAKLDTIKAQLDNLNERVARIERIAEASEAAVQVPQQRARW
jgi:hypothetical protein